MRGSLKFRLIELTSFKLTLSHEAFGLDPLGVIVRTFAGILKIHDSFDGDQPGPFLIAITCTEVEHFFDGSDFKACGNHIFFFTKITLVCFDFFEIDELGQFLQVSVGEDKHVVHCEYHPTLSPVLEEFSAFVDGSFTDFVVP